MRLRIIEPLALTVLLTACGGGGGDSKEDTAISASVNAGSDRQVVEKTEVTFTAQGSPAGGEFTWQHVSGPIADGFPMTGAEITFTVPDVKANSQMVLKVSYVAPGSSVVSDNVTVDITSNNQIPVPVIAVTAPSTLPPKYQDTITLSGASSSDPDENGFIASYRWLLLSGPSSITASSLTQSTLSFSHPLLDANQVSSWQLTVTDDEGGSASTQFNLLLSANDPVVIANAGTDIQAQEFDSVELNASNSATVSGTFQCFWQQLTAGTQVALANASNCTTSFIAPDRKLHEQLKFKLTVTDSQNRSASDEVDVNIAPKKLGKLNDTGIQRCFNNVTEVSCSNDEYPRQDAERGRDSVASLIAKEGLGQAGFDFTKLNQFADELPNDAADFACIRDNVTGLIWEVKEATAGTLPNTSERNAQNSYTWYVDGEGYNSAGGTTCPQSSCGIQALIEDVNSPPVGQESYCGGNNWRLPTYMELLGLLNYGTVNSLDENYFPNLPDVNRLGHLYYWTLQSSADGSDAGLPRAYVIDMQNGNDVALEKSIPAYVRLVRTP
ncbi:PKD domain-containing protein [Pseudoalteromonas sp. T1lg65]|uniref:Lcl C-terminal domain-containing protein n=1 Tax=Pseudoalteromonas sp. T1lg65 TaxID=2077101 RepID=UPI003F796158